MSNLNITPDKWQYTTPLSVQYVKPRSDNAKLVIGQTPGTAVEGSFGTAAAVFSNTDTSGLGYFGNIGYGSTSYLPIGGVYISGHMGGTAASPTQTLNTWYLGGHAFFGIDAGGSITTSSAYHLLNGAYSIATSDAVSGTMDSKYYIGGLLTPMISFNTLDNSIKFNESLFDSDINFYADTVTAMSIDGATGGISTVSTGAADGLSIDTTASTGNGLTVKAQTGYYNFQFKKSDGTNLLYGQWDGGNFHHHLGGSLYYNIHTYNFVIDGNGNSNIGLIISNGAELKLDASITGASPNIREGGGSYATAGVPLTTTNVYMNSVWGWNGSNGYTETSNHVLNHVMLSHTAGDSELRFLNNSTASVMQLEMLNKQVSFFDGTAALPGITNIGDLNTGLYFPASDQIGVSVGGVENVIFGLGSSATVPYVDLLSTDRTVTASTAILGGDSTITIDYASSVLPIGFNYNYTAIFKQNGYGFGSGIGFWLHPKIQNDSGSTRTTGPVIGVAAQTNYQANGGTLTVGFDIGYINGATYDVINSGTLAVTAAASYYSSIQSIGSGATVTSFTDFAAVDQATIAGTLTTRTGIGIEPFTTGTNRVAAKLGTPSGGTIRETLWLSYNADNTIAAGGVVFGSSRDTNLYRSAANTLKTDDTFDAAAYAVGGAAGATGTFTTVDLKTVTVTNGLIVSIV